MNHSLRSRRLRPVSVTMIAAFSFASSVSCSPFSSGRGPDVESAQTLESSGPIEVDLITSFKEALTPKRPSAENCALGQNELTITKAVNFVLAGATCLTLGGLAARPLWNNADYRALTPYGFSSIEEVRMELNETNTKLLAEKRMGNPDTRLLATLEEEAKFYQEAIKTAQDIDSSGQRFAAILAFLAVTGGSILTIAAAKDFTGVNLSQDVLPATWAGAKIASANIADLFANGLGRVTGKTIDERLAKLSMSVEKIFNVYKHPVLEAVPDDANSAKEVRSGVTRRVFRITPASTKSAGQRPSEEFWSTTPHLRVDMTFDGKTRVVAADLLIQFPSWNSRTVKPEKLGSISMSLVKGKPEFTFVQEFQGIFGLFRWGSGHVAAKLPGVVSLFQELVAQFALEIADPDEANRIGTAVKDLVPGEALELKPTGTEEPVYQLTRGQIDDIIKQAIERAAHGVD